MTSPEVRTRFGPADLLLLLEAFALLAFFRLCLAFIPVRRIVRGVTPTGGADKNHRSIAPSERDLKIARKVQWAVNAAARHSFVEFACFPQTLAGYLLLRWQKVSSTIVYGVARSPEGELLAHTWLQVGDKIVTGGDHAADFTEVDRWN